MSMREQQLAKQRVAISRNDYILTFGEVFETSLTFWDSMNSFSVRFAILLTLCHTYCCTWPTVTKALPMPTNSNAHVSPVGSKVMRCVRGIQYKSNKSLRSVLELRSFYGANRSVPRPFCYRLTPIPETVGHSVPKLFFFFFTRGVYSLMLFLSKVYLEMVFSSYKKQRILFFYAKGYKAPTILKLLREESLPCSRVGVAKFIKKFEETGTIARRVGSEIIVLLAVENRS